MKKTKRIEMNTKKWKRGEIEKNGEKTACVCAFVDSYKRTLHLTNTAMIPLRSFFFLNSFVVVVVVEMRSVSFALLLFSVLFCCFSNNFFSFRRKHSWHSYTHNAIVCILYTVHCIVLQFCCFVAAAALLSTSHTCTM